MSIDENKPQSLKWVLILSVSFFAVFLLISGLVYSVKRPFGNSTKSRSGQIFSKDAVGILEINGVIMDSKKTLEKIEILKENEHVKAVVVRINSPGGAVAPSQEIYEAVKNIGKPVVASLSSVAASGGYYIACAAQKIYANPGTITGSIGVIMEFANLEKLYEWAKIRRYSIKTGKFKDMGAEYREMTAEDRALLQGMVDDVLGQFKGAVAEGRKIPMAELNLIADGRIFSGQQAKAVKLVDALGTLDAAIGDAAKLAQIEGKPEVVYPKLERKSLFDYVLEQRFGDDDEAEGRSFLSEVVASVVSNSVDKTVSATSLKPGIYWLWRQ